MSILTGNFTDIIYQGPTGYHVLRFNQAHNKKCVCIFHGLNTPEMDRRYCLQGPWQKSDKYGWQFLIRICEPVEHYQKRHQHKFKQLLDAIHA